MKTYNSDYETRHGSDSHSYIEIVTQIDGDVHLPYVEQTGGGHFSLPTPEAVFGNEQCVNEVLFEDDSCDQNALLAPICVDDGTPSITAMAAVTSAEIADAISGSAVLPPVATQCASMPHIAVSPAASQCEGEEMTEIVQGDDLDSDLPKTVTITELRIDAELQSWIDPLTSEELAGLEASLLQDGCRDPLVVWSGWLLDGHNRYALCRQHGIAFQTVEKTGLVTKADAKIWMIENQLGKRNTSVLGRVALALKLKPLIEQRAQERMLAG